MTEDPFRPAGGEGIPNPRPSEARQSDQPAASGEPVPEEGIRFRDNRRIDPDTYEVRAPAVPAPEHTPAAPRAEPAEQVEDAVTRQVDELTADLQRLSAEYANYRKRVDRDREAQRDMVIAAVLSDLLPVLDDIERARSHDELIGGFKAVADAVARVTGKYGLEPFGTAGEPFDPNVHEAMTSESDPEVGEPTVKAVYQVGYRIRDRVVRPARVAVVDAE